MTNNKTISVSTNRSWGDVAVDGLWPGLVGGSLMMAYFVVTGLFRGNQPLTVFGFFLPDISFPPLVGLVTHLAVSAVHGTVFGLMTAVFTKYLTTWRIMVAAGVFYGLLLWLTAWLIIVPSGLSGLGNIGVGHLFIGHMIYGLTIGRLLSNSRLNKM